jgi:hypothetical protein
MAAALQTLIDRVEIGEVLTRYCTALDTREWTSLREVFQPDAVCDGSLGNPQGVEQITALIQGTLQGLDATQHLLGNVSVTLDGDKATASCYLFSQHIRSGLPAGEDYQIGGRYADRLVRTPEGWRIAHRTLHRMWARGNREVIQRS